MCSYVNENKCSINGEICPFVYFCTNVQAYKPLKSMPAKCNVALIAEIPQGYYRVREERKGYLYVDIGDCTYKIANPFDEVPLYVKATKTKTGWKLKK